jgi:hypothetical protein
MLARGTRGSRFLCESLAGIVNETMHPKRLFSWKGLAQCLLG